MMATSTPDRTAEEEARTARIRDRLERHLGELLGRPVRFRYWQDGNGPMFAWTTERIDGKFESYVYKPVGKGARSDDASEWEIAKSGKWKPVKHTRRKDAKARAARLYTNWRREAR